MESGLRYNPEARMTNDEGSPKVRMTKKPYHDGSSFGFRHSFPELPNAHETRS